MGFHERNRTIGYGSEAMSSLMPSKEVQLLAVLFEVDRLILMIVIPDLGSGLKKLMAAVADQHNACMRFKRLRGTVDLMGRS